MIPARARRRRGPVPVHPFDAEHGTETGALIPGEELATGHRHDRHITAYHGTAPSLFRKLMTQWRLDARWPVERTAFVDVGAGKGRAMLLAAELPFRRIVGVELHPALAAAARRNLEVFAAHRDFGGEEPNLRAKGARRVGHTKAVSQQRSNSVPVSTPRGGAKLEQVGGSPAAGVARHAFPPMRLEEADVLRLRMPAGPCCVFLFNPFDLVLMDRFLDKLERDFRGREEELDLLYVNDEQRFLMLEEHPRFEERWRGRIFLSHADRAADKAIITHCADGLYVTTGYEDCSVWRLRC